MAAVFALTALFGSANLAQAGKLQDFGDFARFGAPLSVGVLAVLMGDYEGLAQYSTGYVSGRLATYGIKRLTQKKRPNFRPGDKKLAFPSGHVEQTWQAAAFVRTRYGCYEFTFNCLKFTVPFAAVAAVTAYSRVDADKHDYIDVLGGVVLAEAITWIVADKFDPSLRIMPTFNNGFGLAIFKKF